MIPKTASTNLNKADCRLNPFQQRTSNIFIIFKVQAIVHA